MLASFVLVLAFLMIAVAFVAFFMLAATFVVLAAFVIAVTFVTFFVFAATFVVFATFMFLAFSFVFALRFTFFAAFRFWHVGLHLFHFLCHVDSLCSLLLIEVFPVGESLHHDVNLSHHLWAWSLLMIAFMMFVTLLFLVFAAFFLFTIFFVFLFVAA